MQVTKLAVALLFLGAVGCGSDSNSPTDEAAAAEIVSEGHEDGDTDGHDLAVGGNTPTDAQGRFVLHHGDRGPDVLTLQERLVTLGASLAEDDDFGDETLHAVLQFQRAEGLTPDGVVGPATWAALDAPANTVAWEDPEVPTEYSTVAPAGTVPQTPTPTSAPPLEGDAATVDPQSPPEHDPANTSEAWAKAVVTLANETATFYDGAGNVVLQAPISSGHDGLTPVGTFHVQSKSERAYAGGRGGVSMNFMTRFNGGIGFHSIPKTAAGEDLPTPLGQRAVSHGCIRMADDQAQLVFENLPIGALVEVHA